MQKNVAGKWTVFAFDLTDNTAVTGDAANITANIRIDGGAANAVDDTNPTELEDGYYIFDITATESNGDLLTLCPASSTADVQVIGVPSSVWTTPANFPDQAIGSDGVAEANLVEVLDTDFSSDAGTNFRNFWDNSGGASIYKLDTWANSVWSDSIVATRRLNPDAFSCFTQGTAQSGTSSTIVLEATESWSDDDLNDLKITILSGTGAGQTRFISDYVGATDTATVATDWDVNPSSDSYYQIFSAESTDAVATVGAGAGLVQVQVASMNTDVMSADALAADAVAEINATVDTALADYDAPTKAELDSGLAALNDPTAAVIADAVWDEAQSGHTSAGTFGVIATEIADILVDTAEIGAAGAGLTEAGGDGDHFSALPINDVTAAQVADAVWDEATLGHTSSGTFGEQLKTDVDAILADTNELQGDDVPGLIAALNDVSSADVNAACDTALSDYDAPTKAELDSGLAALNDLSAAEVNTEVDTALADIHLDHLLAADYDPTSKPGTSTALLNELVESDGGVSRFTTNALEQAPASAGGGDATEAKQDQIIASLSNTSVIYTTPSSPNRLEVVQGDDYDGTANAAFTWTVTGKSFSSETVTVTVRDSADTETVLLSHTDGSASGTTVTVPFTAAQTDTLTVGTHKFDVQVAYAGGEKQTVALGDIVVLEPQTR